MAFSRVLNIIAIAATLIACGGDDEGTTTGGGSGGQGGSGGSETGGGGSGGQPLLNDWDCIGEFPSPTFTDGPGFNGTIRVTEFLTSAALEGVLVKVCYKSDQNCDVPIDEGTTDADGNVPLLVPTDAPHYFDLTGAAVASHMVFLLGPPTAEDFNLPLNALSPETLDLFFSVLNDTQLPERGLVGLATIDCQNARAEEVTFELETFDDMTTLGYFTAQGLPDLELTATSLSGLAGANNVPVGSNKATARVASTGEVISDRTFNVRPGYISFPPTHNPTPEPP
jgi:hypothetical protein